MNDLKALLTTAVRWTLFFLSFCLLLWALLPAVRPVAAGLALGAVVSIINSIFLSLKVGNIAERASQGVFKGGGTGFMTRAAFAVLAVMVSQKVPGINLYAVIGGLFFAQIVTFIAAAKKH
jgi:ATP synthase protein I